MIISRNIVPSGGVYIVEWRAHARRGGILQRRCGAQPLAFENQWPLGCFDAKACRVPAVLYSKNYVLCGSLIPRVRACACTVRAKYLQVRRRLRKLIPPTYTADNIILYTSFSTKW